MRLANLQSSLLLRANSSGLFVLFALLVPFAGPANGTSDAVSTASQLPQAAERIRNEPESVWVEFIQLALEHKPLNLGQGFPDFAAPKYLVEALHNATNQLDQASVLNHQYTRSFGHPRLVLALRDYYRNLRGFHELRDERSQILVTVGAYEALFAAIMAFVGPEDEVLIVDPAFDAYAPMVAMAGGRSVFVPLRLQGKAQNKTDERGEPTGGSLSSEHYGLDMDELRRLVNKRTRVLLLNTPNNPMGKVFSRRELAELAQLCQEHNLLVIADEVYEQFYYAPHEHVSMASLPSMWTRTITIGSAGKTFSVTGWKVGWAFGPEHLIRYLQLVHQTAVYTVATPLQEALARALEHEMALIGRLNIGGSKQTQQSDLYWPELRHELLAKRDRMARVLERAQMGPILPQGGYFMLADFSKLAQLHPEYQSEGNATSRGASTSNDYKFARWMSRVKHLQGIPGSAFFSAQNKPLGANLIRFCFIKSDQVLDRFEQLIGQLIEPQATK